VFDDAVTDYAPGASDVVDDAVRNPGLVETLEQLAGAVRGVARGLEHDGVPGRDGGRNLPDRDDEGVVPGGDETGDADRLAHHREVLLRRGRGLLLVTEVSDSLGVIIEDVDGATHLARSLRDGLALLAGERLREFVAPGANLLGCTSEELAALGGLAVRPLGLRFGRRRDSGVHVSRC